MEIRVYSLYVLSFSLSLVPPSQQSEFTPQSIAIDQSPSIAVPPPFWCDDASLSKQADVSAQCQAYNTSAYGQKLRVTVLYESLCPDCQRFMKDVLYPQVWEYGRDFVDIELVPYGNARHSSRRPGTYEISCQHGPVECRLNKLHSCVIHQLVDTIRWLPFIDCMEEAIGQHVDPDKATKQCYKQQKVKPSEQDKINKCVDGPQGDQLQKAAADRTDAAKPQKHQFVPWIMINDVSTMNGQFFQDALFEALCSWYRGDKLPAGCQGFIRAARQNKCNRYM